MSEDCSNINFLTKTQYDNTTPATNELYAVEIPVLIKFVVDGTNWYKIYSNDWCEQGGRSAGYGSQVNGWNTIQLLKPFNSLGYSIYGSLSQDGATSTNLYCAPIGNKTKTSFQWYHGTANNATYQLFFAWTACGYINREDI